ncbi:MAG: phosphoribosylglycinamide formyltransferase [Microscillaceae bacterium]|jgi:phosphoribosylglycinamide formyltransferase-1|nr:phosphoribosylglycinamide formyltransferase [Microscillaceae bacterium]
MFKIAIFASGSGSNAQKIMETFASNSEVEVSLILSNKSDAYVLDRAKNFGIESLVFDRPTFYETQQIVDVLQKKAIDLVVLAGFLWLIPQNLIQAFPQKIINIHPALLPKYGGKGMYGMKVHEAVWQNQETETGITIHYVNEKYDEGKVILQARCSLTAQDTPETIAQKVHQLEYAHFAQVIADLARQSL